MPSGLPNIIVTAPQPKAWWRSKVLLLNATVLALAAAESQLNVLQPLLPVNVYGLVAFALPVLNAVLRFATTTGVTLRQAEPGPVDPQAQTGAQP